MLCQSQKLYGMNLVPIVTLFPLLVLLFPTSFYCLIKSCTKEKRTIKLRDFFFAILATLYYEINAKFVFIIDTFSLSLSL